MNIDVVIEGVPDAKVNKDIRRAIEGVCRSAYRAGEWSVLVAPSEIRGKWDLGVRGPLGLHFVSFTTDAVQLPSLVAEQLRACF